MTLPSYEKLGVFYLGREYDPQSKALGDELLYDSRDLTTHAVCIGMTGSGKTGLCLSLLEEAAIDGVPAIAIDPKGDIGNLLLTFPDLKAADFQPWVDTGEASRKGQSVEDFASATAETWRKGLAEWNQDGARIQRLRDAAEVAIYTPGSNSGRPLSILRSFTAPDAATSSDATALKERIGSAVAGLLGLLGIDADPIKSREHILLSAILDAVWRKGQSPDLAAIIQAVQKPPFDKVGVFDVESFYPAKERMELALRVNGLLASPGFEAWLEGEALDIQKLLYTDAGKPRISIISIAHLNDAERMFVVTLIANELVAWMRRQSGTTSLRAVFYMDEVFGYFPPSAMPPSKLPLLTLMKQARAFGLGVVLATQNPVDLDYKGLGNAGTWFIGRLQTERDKNRVIEGLLGTEAAGGMDRASLEALMSNLTQRTFLMRNVHDDAPVLLRTRWALSYLRGPLTLAEIKRLTDSAGRRAPGGSAASGSTARTPSAAAAPASSAAAAASRPVVQAGVTERFLRAGTGATAVVTYQPRIGAKVRAHFVDTKAGMNAWEESYYLAPIDKDAPDWSQAEVLAEPRPRVGRRTACGRQFRRRPGRRAVPAKSPRLEPRPRGPRLPHGVAERHVLPGTQAERRPGRNRRRVSCAHRPGTAREARRGGRRTAGPVCVEARGARGPRAAGGAEARARARAGLQRSRVVRAFGGREPARRAVRGQAQQRHAQGLHRGAQRRAGEQGARRRCACRSRRGGAQGPGRRDECRARGRDRPYRGGVRPEHDPGGDGTGASEEGGYRRRGHGPRLVPVT